MTLRNLAALIPAFFLIALIQLIGALFGVSWALLAGAGVGLLSFYLDRVFELQLDEWWTLTLFAMYSSGIGILLPFMSHSKHAGWLLWLAPFMTGAAAAIAAFTAERGTNRCDLCSRRLAKTGSFQCPRCGLVVCDQGCWRFQHARCRLCEQNHVPIFSPDRTWWDRQLGPRIRQGRCQLCLTPADRADLRGCQKCGRPYCRNCWDSANGQCNHCMWTVPDLPPKLEKYIFQYTESQPTRTVGRTRGRRPDDRMR